VEAQRPQLAEAESKLILTSHLIEDVGGLHNADLVHAALKNLLGSQKNLLRVNEPGPGGARLPGVFEYPKSQFGHIIEGLRMKNFGL
jgi:hypothetical protein